MTHVLYILAYLAAVVAALCWWRSLVGVRAELHEDDWRAEGNQR